MRALHGRRAAAGVLAALTIACSGEPRNASAPQPGFPERPFVRVKFDQLTWKPTEGNTLGVETAVVEGDPSKPGYYLTINHFPAGVMSRPHYHPDERMGAVLLMMSFGPIISTIFVVWGACVGVIIAWWVTRKRGSDKPVWSGQTGPVL